jgi:hypothetical protein
MATGKKTWNKLTDDQKKNTYSSYTGVAPEHVDLTGMEYSDLPKNVQKGVKQSQLKAKLLKMRLAATRKYKDTRTRAQKLRDDDIAEYRHQQRIDKNKTKLTKSQLNDTKDDIAERTNDSKTASKKEKKVDKKLKKIGDNHNRVLKKELDARPLIKEVPMGVDKRDNSKINYFSKMKAENDAIDTGKKIRPNKPTDEDFGGIITAKTKINKLKKKTSIPDEIMQEASDAAGLNKNQSPSYIAQDHHHSIVFKGHRLGGFRGASLNSQSGKFAKYWLLNAKETNGNGWGIAAHTASQNMKKFIGRPLVVTAKSWHGASEYGEEYEHPYLPTNDIAAILRHQDKFRVGSIVDVFEDKNGDWFANIEMLPKFANRTLPPFCSPAIYQLDAKENEGQISKWEALHLAALNENPAYGARIAILKGTCMGTGNECKVQFKSAKLEGKVICTKKLKGRIANIFDEQEMNKDIGSAARMRGRIKSKGMLNKRRKEMGLEPVKSKSSSLKKKQKISKVRAKLAVDTSKIKKKKYFNDKTLDRAYNVTMPGGIEDTDKTFTNPAKRKSPFENFQIRKKIDNSIGNNNIVSNPNKGTNDDKKASGSTVINSFKNKRMKKIAKLKTRLKLATLGEQNMTYQDSKKIKIHKKKHPEVRKAQKSVEDILRGQGRSVDGSHSEASFMSSTGDFIGGNGSHLDQILKVTKQEHLKNNDNYLDDGDDILADFLENESLVRVQNFPINRAGEKIMNFDIRKPLNSSQLKSIKDSEIGGNSIGFSVGDGYADKQHGKGYKDLTKALREKKFL